MMLNSMSLIRNQLMRSVMNDTLQDTIVDIVQSSYDAVSKGGDSDNYSSFVNRAYTLDKRVKVDSAELKELKDQLRTFSDEMETNTIDGDKAYALVTPATKPTTRLKAERITKLLEQLRNDGVISAYMFRRCFSSKTPAHTVKLVKK